MSELEPSELEQLINEINSSNLQATTKESLEFLVRYMNQYYNEERE